MDRFKFRLEKVKSYKEKIKKESEITLAQKMSSLAQAENIFEQLKDEKDRDKSETDKILTAADLSLVGDYERFIQYLLEKQKVAIQDAEKSVEIAREDLILKAREEKALSLLRSTKLENYNEDKKRMDRKETSELAIRQYQKNSLKKSEGSK